MTDDCVKSIIDSEKPFYDWVAITRKLYQHISTNEELILVFTSTGLEIRLSGNTIYKILT
jgi:hypothetical protein